MILPERLSPAIRAFFLCAVISAFTASLLYADEKRLIDLARMELEKEEYYHAITETMRYQHLYPRGRFYPESMLIMSRAFYHGGNYQQASELLASCHNTFPDSKEGERALYFLGHIRMLNGSPYFAYRTFQQYRYLYREGSLREEAGADACRALALMGEFHSARAEIAQFRRDHPGGRLTEEVSALDRMIEREENRPKKSMWVSVIGSIFIPGFGHFYTEKYDIGFFSLFTNAALLYLFYDGYRDRDRLRTIVFGIAELSFYQYSLFSAVQNVYEYNGSRNFDNSVRMGAVKRF